MFIKFLLAFLLGAAAAQADEPRYLSYSSGTGFFVRGDGMVLTNYHVVNHCAAIAVSGAVPEGPATLVAVDAAHDLALVKTAALPLAVAAFNSQKQPLRARDRVVVVGYPGQAWEIGAIATREATILSMQGPRGEAGWMEFSDTLEGGNSGGPLLDNAGNVVGVVTAKSDLIHPPEREGGQERVEHFDMAITLPVVRQFLRTHAVPMRSADSGIYLSGGKITDVAKLFVVNVRCQLQE